MPQQIKSVFSLLCLATISALIVAALSDADIVQAAILLLINGFIFMALYTIKFFSNRQELDSHHAAIFADEKQQLLDELAAAKKELQSKSTNANANANANANSGANPQDSNSNEPPEVKIPPGYVHQSVLPSYEISFTPQGSPKTLMLNFIKTAQKELYVAEYDLCDNRTLIEELISAKRRGIDVRILVDYEKNSSPNAMELLKYIETTNIPVYRSTNYAEMKHNFMIADGSEIQLGNGFGIDTKTADSLLVFKNARNMVDNYRNEFLKIANEPQHESVMCNDVGCSEGGIITWKNTQDGYRWHCSTYSSQNPQCKSCELLGDENHLERQLKGKTVNVAEVGCDHQGEVISWISKWSNQEQGEFNQFWSCSGRNKNDELCNRCGIKGNEDKPERSIQPRAGDKCPLCKSGVLKMRRDNYGKYVLGCGNYPACKYPEGIEQK